MRVQQTAGSYLLRLDKGEQLILSLIDFCHRKSVTSGWLVGIGGVLKAELGYYHLDKREYKFQNLDKVLEIVSLSGNVAFKNGQPFLHIHAVLSDEQLQTYGGHLKEAIVGGTCEIMLTPFNISISRQLDEETGLSLLQL